MVARVALATDSMDPTNFDISGLQFQGHSGIDSDINGGMDNGVVISHFSQEEDSLNVKHQCKVVNSSVAYFIQFKYESMQADIMVSSF